MLKRIDIHVMRGPSGCGKTTLADTIRASARDSKDHVGYCSADSFFTDSDGNYNLDVFRLGEAHQSCMNTYLTHLQTCLDEDVFIGEYLCLVLDNTGVTTWEFMNYLRILKLVPVEIERYIHVYQFVPELKDIKILAERAESHHGVPIDVIARQCYNFEVLNGGDALVIAEESGAYPVAVTIENIKIS